jgi:hypothetical protein
LTGPNPLGWSELQLAHDGLEREFKLFKESNTSCQLLGAWIVRILTRPFGLFDIGHLRKIYATANEHYGKHQHSVKRR